MYGRAIWDQADAFTRTERGKRIYAWRKETIERSFAEAKELHGLRFARMLGIRNMYEPELPDRRGAEYEVASPRRFDLFSVPFSCAKTLLSSENMAFVGGLRLTGAGETLRPRLYMRYQTPTASIPRCFFSL